MKKWYRLLAVTFFAIMTTGFLAGPAASADDKSCWLEAKQTVYLSIYDLDSLGRRHNFKSESTTVLRSTRTLTSLY